MKKLLSIIFFLTVLAVLAKGAPIHVSGSNGADGDYATLTVAGGAFDKINRAASQLGKTIIITINGSSAAETGAVTLTQKDWDYLIIYPTAPGYVISGSVNNSLISLNGADKVTIDGRVNGTGNTIDLTIFNTSPGTSAATIGFSNSAQSDTIRYCNLQGSGLGGGRGIIFFSTSASGTGNDQNIIEHNNISGITGSRPVNAIYSAGSPTADNSSIIIRKNNFFDFLNPGTASNGIYLAGNTSSCTISENNFYETNPFGSTAAVAYYIIRINNASGTNFDIKNNYIGGSDSLHINGPWTKSGSDNAFTGISLTAGTGAASNVQNNIISNITWNNTSTGAWTGISAAAGDVNILTNTIGASSGTGSITLTAGATNSNLYGITIAGAGSIDCRNNIIGSITATNSTASNATNIYGINITGTGIITVGSNTIGNTDSGNIFAGSASTGNPQLVYGIYNSGNGTSTTINNNIIANLVNGTTNSTAATKGLVNGITSTSGTNTISGNTIHDLTIANADTNQVNLASVCGIAITGATKKSVTGNTIYNLSNTNPSFTGYVIGLYYTGRPNTTPIDSVSRNFINRLSVTSSAGAKLCGIKAGSGSTTYFNNIVNLGGNTASTIYGIWEPGAAGALNNNNNNIYFNTVYIWGNPSSGGSSSFALFNNANTNARGFENNILVNVRSNSGSATGKHYAIRLAGTTRVKIDYNDYFVQGAGTVLGYLTGDRTSLSAWQTITLQDGSSLNTDPSFISAGSNSATDYTPRTCNIVGDPIPAITTDYSVNQRPDPKNDPTPSMGAFEIILCPTVTVYKAGVLQGSYFRLKEAFDAFNAGTHNTGSFEIRISGPVTEDSSAVLNASGNGSANYDSINIHPSTIASISGNLATPLIDLNGASNVTIDGRVNHSGPIILSIINASNSALAGTSTIRMINGASNNTIKYCNLKGSSTSATSGIVLLSTSTGATGNNNNIIENNNITSSSPANKPVNGLYSTCTATLANSLNIIRNNNFYDILNRGIASNDIFLDAYNTGWVISGNSFYETISLAPTITNLPYYIIRINNTGGNYSVSGNYIGGNAAACSGTPFVKTSSFNSLFYGIYLSAGPGTTQAITNNTIKNINWSNSASGTGSWTAIQIAQGNGIITENVIGDTTTTGSVSVTYATSGKNFNGIYITTSGNVSCLDNKIGSVTLANAATNASNFFGIYKSLPSGKITISGNTIGSKTVANSILVSSASTNSAQVVRGIYNSGTDSVIIRNNTIANLTNQTSNPTVGTAGVINGITSLSGINVISGNIIDNLTIANANSLSTVSASICGIALSGATLKNVTGNTISNLSNSYGSFAGNVTGLYFTGSTSGNVIEQNFIHSLSVSASASAATIYGIKMNSGGSTYSNNIISLGGNSAANIYGIFETGAPGNNNNLCFNTVYIGGVSTTGASSSYALFSNTNTNTRNFRNNIFVNARSNNGASGKHYAIRLQGTTSLTINYNDYFASGTGGILGYLTSDRTTLPNWQTATGQDANSESTDPLFAIAGTAPTDYLPGIFSQGVSGTCSTIDFGGNTRNFPTMGAWEGYINKWKGSLSSDWNTEGNWLAGKVPLPDRDIIFDLSPGNNLVMDQDRSVRNITDSTSYTIVTTGHKLTIKGNLYFSSGDKIDASASSSTVEIASDSIHTIEQVHFLGSKAYNLIINNGTGISLNSNFTVENMLTLNPGKIFTINAPGQATITSVINNGIINLNSTSPSDIFSLMMESYSGSGTANVQLYLTGGGSTGNYNWHFVAVPVNGLSTDYFTNLNSKNLMAYNDSRVVTSDNNGWSYYDGYGGTPGIPVGGGFATLLYGHGYNFWCARDTTVYFSAMPSLGTTLGTIPLQYSGSTSNNPMYGLNLLGNSLTCSIDWNKIVPIGPVSSTVSYVIAQKVSTYNALVGGTNGATKDIPPLQGFMVQATGTGASIDFTNAKEHTAQTRYKKSGTIPETTGEVNNPPKLKLELSGTEGTSDETIVWFNEDATKGYDIKYDGFKLFSSVKRFGQLFSILEGKNYVINGMPFPDNNFIVPLGIIIPQSGNYSLIKKDFIPPDGYDIWLIDKAKNNLAVNIKNTTRYSFNSEAGTFTDRFFLRIISLSPITKYQESYDKHFNIYSSNGMINIVPQNSSENYSNGEVKVFDLMGRIVKQVPDIEWNQGVLVQIPFNEQQGLFMVEVTSGGIRQVGKVFMK